MKNNIFLLFLLLNIFNLSAQSHQENIQKLGKDTVCLDVFEKHHTSVDSILDQERFEYYSTKINSNLTFREYVDCMVLLANSGNQEAHDSIIAMTDFLYRKSQMTKNLSFYQDIQSINSETLAKISSSEAFEVALKFFGQNICISDLVSKENMSDYPDTNYGLITFQIIILPIMEEEQRKHYYESYSRAFRAHIIACNDDDDGMKKFHDIWYPIVKKDWEDGKIKLRHER